MEEIPYLLKGVGPVAAQMHFVASKVAAKDILEFFDGMSFCLTGRITRLGEKLIRRKLFPQIDGSSEKIANILVLVRIIVVAAGVNGGHAGPVFVELMGP
jgi:hypothetical protein